MKLLLLFIITLFLSCYNWTPPKSNNTQYQHTRYVCVDYQISEDQFKEINRAMDTWTRSLSNWMIIKTIRPDNCNYNIYLTEKNESNNPTALAWTTIGGSNIYLIKNRYEKAVYEIILHEFGHCLGAQHLNGTLMDPNYHPHLMSCPDATTVAQVAAYNKIPIELLAWCY